MIIKESITKTKSFILYQVVLNFCLLSGINLYSQSKTIIKEEVLEQNQSQLFAKSIKDSIVQELFIIDETDQMYRSQMESVQSKYGGDSNEMKELIKNMKIADSINLVKIESLYNKYGWLGASVIGDQGNTTLFMVIQHSDLKTQQKYLPVLKTAVKKGNAKARHLALLTDRVALLEHKRQIYGSQVGWNMKTNQYYVLPLEDPDNVDKRRSEVGLSSLTQYLKEIDIIWNVDQYKKELPAIEADFFQQTKEKSKD